MMPADLSIGQIALLACVAVGAVIGLFRGLSGGLGTVCGLAASIAAGWFALDPISEFFTARGWFNEPLALRAAALATDGLMGLVVFGLVRRALEKFVRFLVPRTLDSLLGAAAGAGVAYAVWRAAEMAVEYYRGGGAA